MDSNLLEQVTELEALSSIFGNEWEKCEAPQNTYTIKLEKETQLWITLNEGYPSVMPPQYELWAPKLSQHQKELIDKEFTEIYNINQGCPIIFQWIEKLKDILGGIDEPVTISDKTEVTNEAVEVEHKRHILDIVHGNLIVDRKSTFQAHVCKVKSPSEVQTMLEILLENKKIRVATHNVMAYRIADGPKKIMQDFDNDGEAQAGSRLLTLLETIKVINVAVIVTRWYGGIHLGPDRFRHYNNAAQQTITEAGFV